MRGHSIPSPIKVKNAIHASDREPHMQKEDTDWQPGEAEAYEYSCFQLILTYFGKVFTGDNEIINTVSVKLQ